MRTLFREYRMIRVELATVFKQQSVRANYVCMHMIHKLLMPIKFIRCIVFGPIERCIMNRAAMGNILELWIMELSRRKKCHESKWLSTFFHVDGNATENVTAWCIGFNEHWTQKHCLSFTWILFFMPSSSRLLLLHAFIRGGSIHLSTTNSMLSRACSECGAHITYNLTFRLVHTQLHMKFM